MARLEIFRGEERVDPRRIAAHDAVLVADRKELRLIEIARGEDFRKSPGFPHVVERVFQQGLPVVFPRLRNIRAVHIRAVRRRHAEMLCGIFEIVAFQRAVNRIVEEQQMKGVRHVPAVDVEPRIVDGPFRDAEARGAFRGNGTVPPECELHLVPFCTLLDIRQIKAEDVVPLQNVRITLPHGGDKRLEQFLFRRIFIQTDDFLPAGAVGHGNDDDPVLLPLRIREIELRRTERFDIELHPADLRKGHSVEQTHVFRHERLLDHVREQTVRCARRAGGYARDAP